MCHIVARIGEEKTTMKIEIQPMTLTEDGGIRRQLRYINSPTAVTISNGKSDFTHPGVNIQMVDGQWMFVPAPGFGEAVTAKDEQLRDLQAMVRDLAGGYRRLLDENSSLQSQLETALKSIPEGKEAR